MFETFNTITRAQAIEDGTLVPVPDDIAANAGLCYPTAITRTVWEDCVVWCDEDTDRTGAIQDQDGRLWDVLWMASGAISQVFAPTDRAAFVVHRVPRTVTAEELAADDYEPPAVRLVVVCGPGDDGDPVITIMGPGQVHSSDADALAHAAPSRAPRCVCAECGDFVTGEGDAAVHVGGARECDQVHPAWPRPVASPVWI